MKKFLFLLAALLLATGPLSRADTSYLLIQGPFGSGDAVQTYLWKVLYNPGSLTSSQDLLNSVFGNPVDTGTTHLDAYGTARPYYTAGNSTLGIGYQYFASFDSFLIESFTIGGKPVVIDADGNPAWSSYLAGGSGTPPPDYLPGNYPAGTWTFSGDGLGSRTLANGSFDGWVFGPAYPDPSPTITGGDSIYAPTASNFTNATVVNLVPEPGSSLLLALGLGAIMARRRR